jgi:uncharacterized protein
MADTGFVGTVADFIGLCDSNRIAETIRDSIRPNMPTTNNEFRSWRDGLQKLSNYLRILARSNESISDLGIICELCFRNGGRADVILTGGRQNPVAVVMEIKQWSLQGIEPGSSADRLFAHVGNEARRDEAHPLLQARAYSDSIGNEFEDSQLQLIPIAFLPNMESNAIISHLDSAQEGQNLFLKRNIDEFGSFLANVLTTPDTDLETCLMIAGSDYQSPRITGSEEDALNPESKLDEVEPIDKLEGRESDIGWCGSSIEFIERCELNLIGEEISQIIPRSETSSEFRSWRNGLYRLSVILRSVEADVSVACEVRTHAGRADVILTGRNSEGSPCLVVIEMKQWSDDGIGNPVDHETIEAITRLGPMAEASHPLVQAQRYHDYFVHYKAYFDERDESEFETHAVAFLPNTGSVGQAAIEADIFQELLLGGQVFCRDDNFDFSSFLDGVFHSGDPNQEILREILSSRIGATRHVMLQVNDIVENPRTLVPTTEQQASIDAITGSIRNHDRQVIIVQGNPGTGKTIVGLRALLKMMDRGHNIFFASANTAAANVLKNGRLKGKIKRVLEPMLGTMKNLTDLISDQSFDVLVIDEAQSITPTIFMFNISSISEIIASSRISVFLLDERQMTNFDAYGTVDNIKSAAEDSGAIVHEFDLSTQFRCGNNSNYLEFIGSLLYGDAMPERMNFNFEVIDDPHTLHSRIRELDGHEDKEAALIASYCWPFISKKKENSHLMDIRLANGFEIQWNKEGGGGAKRWMGSRDRIERVGYPPEIQGQELNFAGIILGSDLTIGEDGELTIDPWGHAMGDQSAKCINPGRGTWKKGYNSADEEGQAAIEEVWRSRIRNQYWVLLSRGSEGCFVYSDDAEVRKFFRDVLSQTDRD